VRAAATLERIAAVVMMTTVITVMTGIPRFDRNEEGRTKERSCPKEKRLQSGRIPAKANLNGPKVLE
jgi:hypothetical protein